MSRQKGRSELLYQCSRQQLCVDLKTGENYEGGCQIWESCGAGEADVIGK